MDASRCSPVPESLFASLLSVVAWQRRAAQTGSIRCPSDRQAATAEESTPILPEVVLHPWQQRCQGRETRSRPTPSDGTSDPITPVHRVPLSPAARSALYRLAGLVAFKAIAARTSVMKALSSILSPSRKSIARRVLPATLALNRPDGSSSRAPFAKVTLTVVR